MGIHGGQIQVSRMASANPSPTFLRGQAMSLRDSEAPLSPMASLPKPPCPWPEMLVDWTRLALALGRVVGQAIPLGASPTGVFDLAIDTWRWMWGLPPCSEARKAAFTLGAVALLIERWRKDTDPAEDDDRGPCTRGRSARNGLRAGALLHIAAWHVNDARGEAERCALGHEPSIPPHERVYERATMNPHLLRIAGQGGVFSERLERLILDDQALSSFVAGQRIKRARDRAAIEKAFAELAIASLPDGPWVMTTRDVARFLDFIEEDT